MVFSSPVFLFIFLPIFLLLYVLLPRALRNVHLLIASLFFYLLGSGPWMLVALVLLALTWILGRALGHLQEDPSRARAATLVFLAAIALNLAPLLLFKYLGFLLEIVGDLAGAPAQVHSRFVPLGISFYTFHFLSYLSDIRSGRIRPEPRLDRLALYIFLFPHLIAGPVVRFAEIQDQLAGARRRLVSDDVFSGMVLFIVGLAKKVLLADPLGSVVDEVHGPGFELTTYAAWLAAFCYAFQIYFDFSGYTDMAIGLARILGFRFPRNFDRPYTARSLTEFWQRWHITLSRWFRDYVYIPLGGSRASPLATYRNLCIVFVLCALWHGAAYTFLAWGVGHGLLLVLERAGVLRTERLPLGRFVVFLLVTLLWIPFRADSLGRAGDLLSVMFGLDSAAPLWNDANRSLADARILFVLATAAGACLIGEEHFERLRQLGLRWQTASAACGLCLYVLACLAVVERGFNPFIYFQF